MRVPSRRRLPMRLFGAFFHDGNMLIKSITFITAYLVSSSCVYLLLGSLAASSSSLSSLSWPLPLSPSAEAVDPPSLSNRHGKRDHSSTNGVPSLNTKLSPPSSFDSGGRTFSNSSDSRNGSDRKQQRRNSGSNSNSNSNSNASSQFKSVPTQRHDLSPSETHSPNTHQSTRQSTHQPTQRRSSQSELDAYLRWCETVLGIQSVVEIRDFEYIDHLRQHWDASATNAPHDTFDWLHGPPADKPPHDLPTARVRGLAAAHDIHVGDIVISIPLNALLSVPTTIDHDPVLSRVLGPAARRHYGWEDELEYEVPLLVVAILYHRSLGNDSPIWHYVDMLLGADTESMPFLWTDADLRWRTVDIGTGVRDLARDIRQDVYDMYDAVVGTLVKHHPHLFGPPSNDDLNTDQDRQWMFSYQHFQWAFAMVNSRHHYLPISDLDGNDRSSSSSTRQKNHDKQPPQMQETLSTVSEIVPPANQPTDSWVAEAKNQERGFEDHDNFDQNNNNNNYNNDPPTTIRHSFLAPLADLVNFGPPCLTGAYNAEERAFELIATCSFQQGQEVTFWYSSECSDVIIANYGFIHPLVPPCTTLEEWRDQTDQWKDRAMAMEDELLETYSQVDLLREELGLLYQQLVSCGCDDIDDDSHSEKQRGGGTNRNDPSNQSGASPIEDAMERDALRQRLRTDGSPLVRHEIGVRGSLTERYLGGGRDGNDGTMRQRRSAVDVGL